MARKIVLTETQLKNLIDKVISEQKIASDRIITSPSTKSSPKTASDGVITSTSTKQNPQEWYSQFPCLKSPEVRMTGGKAVWKNKHVLLPEPVVYGTPEYQTYIQKEKNIHKRIAGKTQGGGIYFCDNTYPEFLVGAGF
jgi:hypothetical protein